MKNDLKEIYFDDFIRLKRGYDLPNHKIVEGEYPIVVSTSIKGYHNRYKIEPPCVATGRSGSLGTIQYIDKKCWPHNTSLYVKDFKGNHPKYVYYYLQTMHLENYNSGAGVPTLNQNHLHKIKLRVHSKIEQQKIAAILSAYDDLIENNNRRIAILEEMAQQIYKEWFVRMRFLGWRSTEFKKGVPVGWEIYKVKDLVNRFGFGRTYKKEELEEEGNVVVIDQSREDYIGFHNNEPGHNASSEKPIIIFGDHTCKMQLLIEPFSLAENVIPFTSKMNLPIYFLFYLVKNLIETTEYKRHWTELIVKKVFVPFFHLQENFSKIVKPLFEEINLSQKSNINLRKTRDLLLPRLISGKLSVEKAEKEAIEAL